MSVIFWIVANDSCSSNQQCFNRISRDHFAWNNLNCLCICSMLPSNNMIQHIAFSDSTYSVQVVSTILFWVSFWSKFCRFQMKFKSHLHHWLLHLWFDYMQFKMDLLQYIAIKRTIVIQLGAFCVIFSCGIISIAVIIFLNIKTG